MIQQFLGQGMDIQAQQRRPYDFLTRFLPQQGQATGISSMGGQHDGQWWSRLTPPTASATGVARDPSVLNKMLLGGPNIWNMAKAGQGQNNLMYGMFRNMFGGR